MNRQYSSTLLGPPPTWFPQPSFDLQYRSSDSKSWAWIGCGPKKYLRKGGNENQRMKTEHFPWCKDAWKFMCYTWLQLQVELKCRLTCVHMKCLEMRLKAMYIYRLVQAFAILFTPPQFQVFNAETILLLNLQIQSLGNPRLLLGHKAKGRFVLNLRFFSQLY